ncbi:MAG: hypothetical protein K8J31_21460, partial [Anaerolineae bacterium]|nr:hypothetical protein [Anaerolineae bacterium]
MIRSPYRGDGTDRPADIPLPPGWMPLFDHGRLLKRWRYVSIWSSTLSICASQVWVGPIPQEFWAIWDRSRGRLYEHTRLWTGRVHVPAGQVRVRDGSVEIDVELDEQGGFEVVTFDERAYTWTRKQCGIRAHGCVRIGGEEHPVEAVALIDDNAGYPPGIPAGTGRAGPGTISGAVRSPG